MNRTSSVPKSVLRYILDKGQYFDLETPLPNLVSQKKSYFEYSVLGIYKVCLIGHTWYILSFIPLP